MTQTALISFILKKEREKQTEIRLILVYCNIICFFVFDVPLISFVHVWAASVAWLRCTDTLVCRKSVFVCVHTSTFFFSFTLLLFSVFPFLSPLSSSSLAYTYSSSNTEHPSSFVFPCVFLRATHTLTNEEPKYTRWLIYTVLLFEERFHISFILKMSKVTKASENVESIQGSRAKLVSLDAI